jgi:enamine deaminase RidA (YjgF/YER057c/UK114 family)
VRNIQVSARNAADARDEVVSAVGCNFDDIVSVESSDPNYDDYGNWVGPVAGENGWIA